MPEQQNEPLISSQTSVNMGPDGGDSNRKALKVAGITVLACALIAGQALTAYFLLSQKSQISSLEEDANSLKQKLTQRQSGSAASINMPVPMSSMSLMTDESTKDAKLKPELSALKPCIKQAVEAGPNEFRPECDNLGNFLPRQCSKNPEVCWCVNANGRMIPGTMKPGKVRCGDRVMAMARMSSMSSTLGDTDE
ncbi:hypothetical protein GJAV_G00125000 [Gymnothorax javanicus]|nr:hypothetical protein GJAV_G00125000 [Gymnothorax javanicus]